MSEKSIRLEQCLFGYEDGHRLLASSIPLESEAAALTELSDLAPGTVFGQSEGYWTGLPVPGIGRYALMRTWPAPEMPRPGCVWTHAILLAPALLQKLSDLRVLRSLFVRPNNQSDRERYRESLESNLPLAVAINDRIEIDAALVIALLEALYAASDTPVIVTKPGELDEPLFAIWSQQWPRLRRNIRFQTAATREPRSPGGARFDVTATLMNSSERRVAVGGSEASWLKVAAADAREQQESELRRFLWSYGADVRRQRGSFRPLVDIKLLHDAASPDAGPLVLNIVTSSFPDPDDAILLKQRLVDGELVPSAQLEVLWYIFAQGDEAVFPPPTEEGIGRLAHLWPERPGDLLHLAERTADANDALGESLFATITGAVPIEHFWRLTEPYLRVRERMVQARPDLLADNGALELDDDTMLRMLRLVPAKSPAITAILPHLLTRDHGPLANETFERFPRETAAEVVAAVDGGTVRIGRAWTRELVRRPSVLLESDVMRGIRRTSHLYELADALGWLKPEVVAAGCDPWIAALVDITSDLPDDKRDTLRSFLVALAIVANGEGGLRLLEKFFDLVHDQELRSKLPWRAREILLPVLADVGWGKGWDYGLRLRLAVAGAFVRNGYPQKSYGALSRNRKVRVMLADAASKVSGGKPYAQAASA